MYFIVYSLLRPDPVHIHHVALPAEAAEHDADSWFRTHIWRLRELYCNCQPTPFFSKFLFFFIPPIENFAFGFYI
jgi:hypothetical protein